jgi:hypothetical protein
MKCLCGILRSYDATGHLSNVSMDAISRGNA